MSLPAIAQHMSSYGRNGDTMLVHMTPSEVHGLQALAEKHGTTLTINPHTGLPEAFGLKDFVKAAAPIALGAALGPAGFGLASSAMGAGFMVGGVTALATGNLKQGLMAGLGAYGGYGLSEGLTTLGAEELAKKQAEDEVAKTALSGTDLASDMATQKAAEASAAQAAEEGLKQGIDGVVTAAPGTPTTVSPFDAAQTGQTVQTVTQVPPAAQPSYFDKLGAGVDRVTSTGGLDALSSQMNTAGGPSLSKAAMATAGSALGSGLLSQGNPAADAEKLNPGYIRPYSYNPFGQKYTAYTPVKADEWGSRTLAGGGIVALADGGSLADQRLAEYQKFEAAQQPQAAVAQAPTSGLTGGSKAAYDYLMGSGEYPTAPSTPTGQIFKPYAEATMGMKADPTQFATTFNPATRQYENNPNYQPFTYDMATGQETRGMSGVDINKMISNPENLAVTKPETAPSGWMGGMVEKLADNETRPYWMVANNLSYEDLSRATGTNVADVMKRFPKTATPATSAVTKTDVLNGDGGGYNTGGLTALAGGGMSHLGDYSDGGRLLKGPGDGVSDSIPAQIGDKQPARLADGEFVVPARIVSEIGNGSTDAGARKLYQMMDRVQKARGKTTGKGKVAANSRSDKYLPA